MKLFSSSYLTPKKLREYKRKSALLVDAITQNRTVKLISRNDHSYKLKRLFIENGIFYGCCKKNNEEIQSKINLNYIANIENGSDSLAIEYIFNW